MGLTHYWQYNRDFTLSEWANIRRAYTKLVSQLPDIKLAGPEGEGAPELTGERFAFNGALPHAVEPFVLYRTAKSPASSGGTSSSRPRRAFCKTEYQPYDLAVRAMLILAEDIAPGALTIHSDEDMNGEGWSKAKELAAAVKMS